MKETRQEREEKRWEKPVPDLDLEQGGRFLFKGEESSVFNFNKILSFNWMRTSTSCTYLVLPFGYTSSVWF